MLLNFELFLLKLTKNIQLIHFSDRILSLPANIQRRQARLFHSSDASSEHRISLISRQDGCTLHHVEDAADLVQHAVWWRISTESARRCDTNVLRFHRCLVPCCIDWAAEFASELLEVLAQLVGRSNFGDGSKEIRCIWTWHACTNHEDDWDGKDGQWNIFRTGTMVTQGDFLSLNLLIFF